MSEKRRVAIIGPVNDELMDALCKQLSDKPAATGSGEPHKWEQQEWITAAATDIAERFAGDGDKGKVRSLTFAIIARHAGTLPTPPASQSTVTLSRSDPHPPVVLTRTQYSNLIGDLLLAKDRISRGQLSLALETVDRMLALLRAAEQK